MGECPPPIDWKSEIARVLPTVSGSCELWEGLESEVAGKLSRDWIGNHCDFFAVSCKDGSVRIAVCRGERMIKYVEFLPLDIPDGFLKLMMVSDVMDR